MTVGQFMRLFRLLICFYSMTCLAVFLISEARASACVPVKTAKIRFDSGRTCWIYSGTAGSFEGRFSAGQSIGAFMKGYPEVGARPKQMRNRDISVDGPAGFTAFSGQPGFLNFVAPSSGLYRFVVWPCPMQGGFGKVEICAK